MPDSILTVALDESRDAIPPPRPLKRQRRPNNAPNSNDSPPPHDSYSQAPAQLDHIFIADGIANKKGAKKTPLSCAECRRLKLRCDRSFPCASCKKRGCAEICPEGVLVSGKGTRFILANTEQLHAKIIEMSNRIRHLEEALEVLQAACSTEPHPLLVNPDLLNIKSTMGLYGGTQTGAPDEKSKTNGSRNGADGMNGGGSSDGRGHTSVSPASDEEKHEIQGRRMEVDASETPEREVRPGQTTSVQQHQNFSAEVMRLSERFPVTETVSPEPNAQMRAYIRSQLPSREEAAHLWEQARSNALWQYNPHPNETFLPNLLHHVYTSPLNDLCPRRLALLLMILAIGSLVDLTQPASSPYGEGVVAENYHHLARAALCEIPVMEETNTDTITALFYEIWYLLVFSDKKKAAGYAFGLMGLTARLAQSIGLHRDGIKSKMIPEEVEKRRSLFWELMYLDARLSLSLGRPPSLFLSHVDCKRPSYQPDEGCDPAESLHYFQEWKHSSYIACLSPVLEVISSPPSALNYEVVIDLDRGIREFTVPPPLRGDATHSRQLMMQKASLSTALEAVLLQLHRTFFTRALSGPERAFNRRHPFAPSVVAVFLSASRMIATVEALFRREPALTARILAFWSNAFSAAVALCLLVSRAPFTCLSPAALQELERARVLFEAAKDTCPRAMQVVPILNTMVAKANLIYTRWAEGDETPTALRHTFTDMDHPDSMMVMPNSPQLQYQGQQEPDRDSFAQAHRSLSQCIAEVHQRAMILFPTRKPCQCSAKTATRDAPCPPSHSWSPPPKLTPTQEMSPVLPDLYSSGKWMYGVLPGHGPGVPGITLNGLSAISPSSRMAVVDTLNFDFGALNQSSWSDGQSWMAWF